MPELPEVETIKRGLSKLILNKKIIHVEVRTAKSFLGGKTEEIEGAKIKNLHRRGKALIIDLDNGLSMMIHLRMTGQLVYVGKERFAGGHPNESMLNDLPDKQTRVIFTLDEGKLFFNDQRKFGFVKILKTDELEKDEFIAKLGKEPWEMSGKELFEKLKKHKNSPIKGVLLDQTVMAGLGNIYADETLYFAKIHPETKAGKITENEAETLVIGARKVMDDSLDSGGSTIRNYVRADGTRGNYLDLFAKVYGRAGLKCERCGSELEKKKIAGRGSCFCPNCQRREEDD